ncbi:MAG TPA: DUF1223 domain-containing protein [Chitinophagaceae bacterium]|nr:DUF1223 domain-containing protein [Chitinophagaceae bacterium]
MKNYQRLLVYVTMLLSGLIVVGFSHHGNHTKHETGLGGFAVIELFTSEGCSSCPAAEELAIKFHRENYDNVFMLSYHVDYWNRLGWKDEFSNADYTNRQKAYASAFRLKSLYTPQFVINGKTEFTGTNEIKLRATVQRELRIKTPVKIHLDASMPDGSTMLVSCRIDNPGESMLHVTLVQKQAQTAVTRGENQGRKLQHLNIVRDFKTLQAKDAGAGNIRLQIPSGLTMKDLKVIAFVQDPGNFSITAAQEKEF